MATIESRLRSCLVDTDKFGGVHFNVLPLNFDAFPAVVISSIRIVPDNDVCDYSMETYSVQVDLYAKSINTLLEARPHVLSAIKGEFEDSYRTLELSDYNSDTKIHRRILEFKLISIKEI